MATVPQTFSRLGWHSMEDTLGYASAVVGGVQRLFDIQCETTKAILDQQGRNVRRLFEAKDPGELMHDPAQLFNTGLEQLIEGLRKSGAVMIETQNELQRLARKHLEDFSEDVESGMEAVTAQVKEVATPKPHRRAA